MGVAIVIVIRLTVPLAVLRWPFQGALAAIAADGIDIIIFQLTDFPGVGYHRADKALDLYYMALFAWVAQGWEPDARIVANALFGFRIAGVAAYELTDVRVLLFFFPNTFEFFYLLVAGLREFRPSYEMTLGRSIAWAAVLTLPKLLQEYALHYAQWLDRWRAVDIIDSTIDAAMRRVGALGSGGR